MRNMIRVGDVIKIDNITYWVSKLFYSFAFHGILVELRKLPHQKNTIHDGYDLATSYKNLLEDADTSVIFVQQNIIEEGGYIS